MAKVRIVVAALLSLLLIPISPTNSAVKAGGSCKKFGQVSIAGGKQYTCVKKGKKLVWNAGKIIAQAAPKPSVSPTATPTLEPTSSTPTKPIPSPTATPTPEPQPSKLVSANALAVQELFDEVWKRDLKSKAKYEIFIDPSRPNSKWAQEHVAVIETTLELLAKMGYDLKNTSKIYIGWDWKWMQQFMPRNSWCYEGSWAGGGYCGEGINFVNLQHTGNWLRTGGQEIDWPSPEVRMAATTILPHELGHQAQGELSERTPGRNVAIYPAWLREGGMNLLKTVVYARINKMSYVDARELFFKQTDKGCAEVPLMEMLMSGNHPKNCNYTGGYVASEALIARDKSTSALFRFGASKIAQFGPKFDQERQGISNETYRSIMKEIYNIDIDEWHPIVEAEMRIWTP
jgi:hypothetical protein